MSIVYVACNGVVLPTLSIAIRFNVVVVPIEIGPVYFVLEIVGAVPSVV